MPEPLLSVRDIHTYYGDSYVLQGLSLELAEGRIVAILGRNGKRVSWDRNSSLSR